MEKKFTISTPPPVHFPKITFTSCSTSLPKPRKKTYPHIPPLPSTQIAQTLETSISKLILLRGAKRMEREKKLKKSQSNPKPTLNKKLINLFMTSPPHPRGVPASHWLHSWKVGHLKRLDGLWRGPLFFFPAIPLNIYKPPKAIISDFYSWCKFKKQMFCKKNYQDFW
jgi:hypothetical protein